MKTRRRKQLGYAPIATPSIEARYPSATVEWDAYNVSEQAIEALKKYPREHDEYELYVGIFGRDRPIVAGDLEIKLTDQPPRLYEVTWVHDLHRRPRTGLGWENRARTTYLKTTELVFAQICTAKRREPGMKGIPENLCALELAEWLPGSLDHVGLGWQIRTTPFGRDAAGAYLWGKAAFAMSMFKRGTRR